MEKIIIIGVGWEQIPLVCKAKERGLYVIATTCWDKNQIPADKVYEIDSRDLDGLASIVEKERPDYAVADECDYSMYAVAWLAEKYHLNGPELAVQTITNNKFLQREYVSKTDVLQPQYKLCWNLEMAKDFIEKVGYPVMVKPIDNRGSIGVSKVHEEDELEETWLQAVSHSHSRLCIVEKCINGEVITADGFCDSFKYEFIAPSNKKMYKNNDNLAKIVFYPGKFSEKIFQKIKHNAELVVEAIGIRFGFVHIEFIIEKETSNIYLVEVANRGGGVYTSNIVLEKITGIDYCGLLLDLAMGKTVDVSCNQTYIDKAIIYFLELKGDKVLGNYIEEADLESDAIYVNCYRKTADVNKEAAMGRHGVAIFSGQSFTDLVEAGEQLEKCYCRDEREHFRMNK